MHGGIAITDSDDPRIPEPPPDLTPSLVRRLRAGDMEAAALLNALYRRAMMRFCWGYLGNVEEAEDATQEVFWKVLRTDTVPDHFRAWLYKVARNHCLNALRARAHRHGGQALPPDSQLDAELTGNLTRLAKQELRSRIGHLLGALPADQREVLRLRYTEGLARSEIAEVLNIPERLVKSRLFDGLKKLREHMSLLGER